MSMSSLRSLCLACALGLGLSTAGAGKPQWVEDPHHHADKGKGHRNGHGDGERRAGPSRAPAPDTGVSVQIQIGGYFGDDQRRAARAYYEPRWRAGKCPPGLAKKGNGCQPPGQARKWQRGEPLPRGVVVYSVPTSVQVKLGTPPAGHKFVRVAADILLIAIGTGMVIDAIEDLGGL
jgi:Ni/Co efflux regulator RcnB